MANDGEKSLRKLQNVIGQLASTIINASKIQTIAGLFGTYINGDPTVVVANRPDRVYVRIGGNQAEVVEAFNDKLPPQFDLKVLLAKDDLSGGYYVYSRDTSTYNSWGGNVFLPLHAKQHSLANGTDAGIDPVFSYKRQILQPLNVHPVSTGNALSVYIEGDFYKYNDTLYPFYSTGTPSFSSYKPTGSYGRYITVYLDPRDGNINYLTGIFFPVVPFYGGNYASYIPLVTNPTALPLAAIYITSGTAYLNYDNIVDLRNMMSNGMGIHEIDPIHGYHTGTLSASSITVSDANNYYNNTTVETILQEVYSKITGTYPVNYVNVQRSLLTGAVSNTPLISVPSGTYRISTYGVCTQSCVGGILDINFGWFDDVQPQTVSPFVQVSLTTGGVYNSGNIFIRAITSGSIYYTTAVNGIISGVPNYNLSITVEKLT